MRPSGLIEQIGGSYARELGIELSRGDSGEIYKWFIAALLFGARITEKIAISTYREFAQAGVLSPRKMLDAGWDRLVEILDRGGYVRYDFKTATKLLDVNGGLMQQYKGDLNTLHDSAVDAHDLEQRLKHLGKGIGDVTVNIFLRELRGIWPKANPLPSERVLHAAQVLGFIPEGMHDPKRALQMLKSAWRTDRMTARNFADFEAGLVRAEAALRRKARHEALHAS